MKRLLYLCWLPWCLAACGDSDARNPPGATVLYVTHAEGFEHSVLPYSVSVLQGMTAVEWEADASKAFTQSSLASREVIVFFTSGELPLTNEQRQLLLDFVAGGGGFVGIHSATDTFYDWPEYGTLIGGYFNGHPWRQRVTLTVHDADHPVVDELPEPTFTIADEIYQFRDFVTQDTTVLLSLDTSSVDMGADGVEQNVWGFPISWTRPHGQGRVFYTALGHGDISGEGNVWDDTFFRTHLAAAIEWARGDD